jgi:hypothetical protein
MFDAHRLLGGRDSLGNGNRGGHGKQEQAGASVWVIRCGYVMQVSMVASIAMINLA